MFQLKQQPPAAITGGGIIKDAAQTRSGRMAMGVMIPASAAALYQSAGISFSKYAKSSLHRRTGTRGDAASLNIIVGGS